MIVEAQMFTRRGLFAFFGLAAASPGLAATSPTSWSVHDTLKARLDPEDYDAWFSRMEIEGPVQDPLLLTFPSKFQTRWVDHYYHDELLGAVQARYPTITRIQCVQRKTKIGYTTQSRVLPL